MTQGLYPRLALAAVLLVGLSASVLAADEADSANEDTPRIFEEFSLTSATTEAPPPPAPPAVVPLTAPPTSTSPGVGPGPCVGSPYVGSPPCVSPPGCCAPVGCGQNACCDSWACPIFYAGVEALFLHASARGMDASAGVANTGSNGFGFQNSEDFDRWTFSPRLTVGVQDCGWGFETRFFYLSDSTDNFAPFFPAPGSGLGDSLFERLKAYTIDWEITRSLCLGTSKVDLFFGGRYASFEADQGIAVTRQTAAAQIAYSNVFNAFDFNGLGVTMGFQGRTPIGCDTCISVLWGFRASVLWGDANRGTSSNTSAVDIDGAVGTDAVSAYAANDETAFILEAVLGLQWDHELRCLPMSAYLRVAAEYQYWDLGDKGAVSAVSTAPSGTATPTASGSVGDVDANFIGLTVGAGFNW